MDIRAATPGDLEEVFELLSLQSRAAFGVSDVAREHVEQSLATATTEHLLAPGGYASLDATQDVVVASRDATIGDALLAAAAERARTRGFDHLRAIVAAGDEPFVALVEREDFQREGEVLRMWRRLDGEPPAPSRPNGISIRTYAEADSEAVHALLDQAYSAWDATYVPRTHDDWLQWMTAHDEFDPALWFLAERDGALVGCCLCWSPHQARGWIKDLAVLESERGRGIAKALLHEAFDAYVARGAESVGLKVDSTNPTGALKLYEHVGFSTDQRYGVWVKVL